MSADDTLTRKAAAAILGCTRANVYYLLRQGGLRDLRRPTVEAFARTYRPVADPADRLRPARARSWFRLPGGEWVRGGRAAAEALGLGSRTAIYELAAWDVDAQPPEAPERGAWVVRP